LKISHRLDTMAVEKTRLTAESVVRERLPYDIESMWTAEIGVAGVSRRYITDWISCLPGVDRLEMVSTVADV
jgi:hypothetical protein